MAAGRPSREFDLVEVEKLGMLGTTAPEMAAWFNCSLRTIERRVGKLDGEFRRAYDKGFGRLKISLRRQQIESAKGGNVTMLIWLGKQLLDQADKRDAPSRPVARKCKSKPAKSAKKPGRPTGRCLGITRYPYILTEGPLL